MLWWCTAKETPGGLVLLAPIILFVRVYYIGLSGPEEGLGAGLDSCVLPTRHEGISIVQTTDLYPLIPSNRVVHSLYAQQPNDSFAH